MGTLQFIKYLTIIVATTAGLQAKCHNPLFTTELGASLFYSAYDSLLLKYQIHYTDHWIETNLGTCHLIETGNKEAPPVLLLPAAGCSAAGWYANLNEIGKHNRVFALDIPGDAGKSTLKQEITPHSIEEYNTMLISILEKLDIREVTLIGHSIGGFLATGFTISHAERVKKLVLVSPVATHINIKWYFKILLQMGGKPGKGPDAEKTLRMQAHKSFEPEPLFVNVMQCVRDYCQVKLLFPYVYSKDELSGINVPIFMIIGNHEVLCNYKRSIKKAKKKFENIDVFVINETGHTPNMEKAEAFNKILIQLLDN